MPRCEPAEPAWEALCLLKPLCLSCSSLLGWRQLKSSFRSALPCDVTPWLDLNLITERLEGLRAAGCGAGHGYSGTGIGGWAVLGGKGWGWAKPGRTGQNREEWGRTGPNRAEPGRTGQNREEPGRTRQDRAVPSRAGHGAPPGGRRSRSSQPGRGRRGIAPKLGGGGFDGK